MLPPPYTTPVVYVGGDFFLAAGAGINDAAMAAEEGTSVGSIATDGNVGTTACACNVEPVKFMFGCCCTVELVAINESQGLIFVDPS